MDRRSRKKSGRRSAVRSTASHASNPNPEQHAPRKPRTGKRILIVALSTVTFCLVALVVTAALLYSSLNNRITVSEIPEALSGTLKSPADEAFTLAIFGTDTRDPSERGLTDVVILAQIDPVNQQSWLVSIHRDTRVAASGQRTIRVNEAYYYGGPNMAIQAVKDITGQDVDHFLKINFWGFADIIDAMGGIYVDVPIAINDRRADFTEDRRASRIEPGFQNLDGAHALTLVRHRDGYDDATFGRIRTQEMFFRALIEQMGEVPLTRLPEIAWALADNTSTSLTLYELAQVAQEMRGVEDDNFHTILLPGEWAYPFTWLDEEGAAEVWQDFGVRPFTFEPDEE